MRDGLGRVGTVAVIGGRSAIGQMVATRLVIERSASTVVLAGRHMRKDDARPLERLGATTHLVDLDLVDLRAHRSAVDAIFGGRTVDVVVLAAGVLPDQETAEADPGYAAESMMTNYVGPAHLLLHVARALEAQGTGTLVVLSSIAAAQARRSNFVYGSAKAGLDAFGRGLADLLEGSGARAVVVRPGFVRTPMTAGLPEAPFAQDPDGVAAAVLRAIDGRSTTSFTSAPVAVLGRALMAMPRSVLRRLPERS